MEILPVSDIFPETTYSTVPAETISIWLPYTQEIVVMPLVQDLASVEVSSLSSFPTREVVGEDEAFNHEWLSGLVQDSWAGGGQVLDADTATQLDRYYDIATLDTRRPQQLELMPETVELPVTGTGFSTILGDFKVDFSNEWSHYICRGVRIWKVDGQSVTNTGDDLAATPVAKAEHFWSDTESCLVVPMGEDGYQCYDGTTVSTQFTTSGGDDFHPISFRHFSGGLWALDKYNWLWGSGVDPSANVWTKKIRIDGRYECKHLDIYKDATGAPLLVVVTDRRLLAVDVGTELVYETSVTWPAASIAAGASCMWGTNFYVTYGADLIEYTGQTWKAVGLKRNSGIRSTNRAAFLDICEGWNEVIGLLSLPSGSGGIDYEDIVTSEGGIASTGSQSEYYLLSRDEFGGWHTYWSGFGEVEGFEGVTTTREGGSFAAIWCAAGKFYRMELNPDFLNPGATLEQRHTNVGVLISSWFYPVGKARRGIAVSASLICKDMAESPGRIYVAMQVDSENSPWLPLFDVNESSVPNQNGIMYMKPLSSGNYGNLPDGTLGANGVGFYRFRYIVQLESTDPARTPQMRSLGFAFMPKMGELKTFAFRVDCSGESPDDRAFGKANVDRQILLDSLSKAETMVGFSYGRGWHMVRVVGVNGYDPAGGDMRGDRHVTCVETLLL